MTIDDLTRRDADAYHLVMSRLQATRMDHGLCQPRERRACTHCNAVDDINRFIDEYKGPRIVLA